MNNDFKAPVGGVTLNKTFNQLGILVLDGSGSMGEEAAGNTTKAKHVESAVIEMFNRFDVSRIKQNFSFGCIKFDSSSDVILEPTAFDFNELMKLNYDPLDGKGGGTYINLALEKAKEMAEGFINNPPEPGIPHKVLIMLLSDGMCFEPVETQRVSEDLKSNPQIEIASAYISAVGKPESDVQNLCRSIASNPVFYTTVYNGEQLRSFFVNSLSASAGVGKSEVE